MKGGKSQAVPQEEWQDRAPRTGQDRDPRKPNMSRSNRSGLQFPVGRYVTIDTCRLVDMLVC